MTEIRWLEAFVAVAEELHFGRAAQRLHTSQSPLSQTIRKLEADLGTRLFERNTRSVALTPAGYALLPRAYRVLHEMRLAREAAQTEEAGVRGNIRIGFSGAVNHLTLPPLTRAVRRRYPDIKMDLTSRVRTADGLASVAKGALDLAFVGLPESPPASVMTRLVASEEVGAVLPLDHPLAQEQSIPLKSLATDDFISPPLDGSSSMTDVMLAACQAAGFRPRIVQELSDPYMVLTFVAAGVGVTLMSSGIAGIIPSGATYVALDDPPHFMNHAIAWSAENDSAVLAAVLGVVEEIFPEIPR
ncbi:LysR family transcriptional regulator [Arthrobacter sp. FX8]|jgi:DNA-binding transcriptional LysR family regulator|uniref:LysR family transcriptional regulator n=1 Tax=unclassified Arthrobacter TaxID=235627 RepID=UPI000378F60E|nr:MULTISPECIES: LysR family transcriptional regulator [unclassified Arthrobacter]WAJ32347.1 LysR family transcriptional regulator [Arthrobacter sp. FX8]BCW56093.1 transcriptional regulator [Arthrobacter sp. StoSoilB19]BCW77193.1 transcriptional regulator [Arthrobacter sp. NicSoilB11]